MKSELEPIELPAEQYVLDPEGGIEEAQPTAPSPAPGAELPWRRPLDARLRSAVRTGGVVTLLAAALLAGLVRAYWVGSEVQTQMRTEARTIAASVAGAMSTDDWGSAFSVLNALGEKRYISGVALFDPKGKRFADYAVSNAVLKALPQPNTPFAEEAGFATQHFPGSVTMWEPVSNKGDAVGWLVLEADLTSHWRSLYTELAWMGAAMLAAVLFGALWINRMQHRMTEPLYRLARTSKVMAEDGDYTLRAWKDAHDEVGRIADTINRLLDELQQRDAALAAARMEAAKEAPEAREVQEAQEAQHPALEPQSQTAPGDNDALRLRTQLLSNMCHEIRTPMTRAVSAAEQLGLTGLDAKQREYLAKSRDAAEFVLNFADDMLDYIRIESGRLELQEINFDPGEAVRSVIQIYHERALSRQIKLSAQLQGPLPAQVRGDPGRLCQVMGSLVANAIKFSQGGEIALEMSAGERTGSGVPLLVRVKDSGIGIAEEARIRIYQSFAQADEKLGAPTGSASLGLSIARQIVRRMGGELLLDGTVEQSTGFRFTIGVEEVGGARDIPLETTPVETAAPGREGQGNAVAPALSVPSEWEQLIEVYVESAEEFVARLAYAVHSGDAEQARAAARTLRGCSAKIGAHTLAQLCQKIEETIRGNDFPGAQHQLRDLVLAYEEAALSLRRAAAPAGPGQRNSIPETV
ncbi:MAG: ATP-binding protein [Burkholderiales bacterium]